MRGATAKFGPDGGERGVVKYSFLAFELDLEKRELRRQGELVTLSAQSFALLLSLIRARGRTLSRDELLAECWQGVTVGEGALRQAVWELRQLLGDEAAHAVATVRGHGYRFEADVQVDQALDPLPAVAPDGLYGREQQLASLEEALTAALDTSGRAAVLSGIAGVGKSRLAREVIDRAQLRGVACVEARSARDGSLPPMWPWLQVLETALLETEPSLRARCEAFAPAVFSWLAPARYHDATLDGPDLRRQHLFDELARVFVLLSQARPFVFLLDDLHWADETSLAFLAHFAATLAQSRMFVIVTTRPPAGEASRALPRALDALRRGPSNLRVSLENLSEQEVASLLAEQCGAQQAAEVVSSVHALTHGNPLFARELARVFARTGECDFGEFVAHAGDALRAVLARRLDELPEAAGSLLAAASVLGTDPRYAQLIALRADSHARVLEQIDECTHAGFLREDRSGVLQFTHPLIQEVAYARMPRAVRARLHALAGSWLEGLGSDVLEKHIGELAYHFGETKDPEFGERAAHYAVRAAQRALAATAYQTAIDYCDGALASAQLVSGFPASTRLDIELLRAEALAAIEPSPSAMRARFSALGERAAALALPLAFARAAVGFSGQKQTGFVPTRMSAELDGNEVTLLSRALIGLDDTPSELRVLVLCSLAYALFAGTTQRDRGHALLQQALSASRMLGRPALTARVLHFHVYLCATPRNLTEQFVICDEMVAICEGSQLRLLELEARIARVRCAYSAGNRARALVDLARAAQLARELDTPEAYARCDAPALLDAFGQGRLNEVEKLAQSIFDATPGDPHRHELFMVRMASVRMLRGEPLGPFIAVYESLSARYPQAGGLRALLASAYSFVGRKDDALDAFDGVARNGFSSVPDDVHWLPTMSFLADVCVVTRDQSRAALLYDRLLPFADQFFCFGVEATPAASVSLWLGELSTVLGQYARAKVFLERARALHAALEMPLQVQLSNLAMARLLTISGSQDGSHFRTLVRDVREFAEAKGIGWLKQRADELEARGGTPPATSKRPSRELSGN